FLGGVVSYRTDKKMELLGVSEEVIARDGVVSRPAARLMADAARRLFHSGLAISVTGVAGPQRQEDKPVGLTYLGLALGGRTPVSPFSAGEMSQVTVVPSQLGKSARAVHLTRFPGFSSSTRIRCDGPPKPKVAIAPTRDSAWLSEVQKAPRPLAVETAS